MKKFLMVLATLLVASTAFSQTQPLTQPQVLGCTNPAPAISGQPTVFFSACKTPAFLPLTTTSVVASTSKTSPSWVHSLSGYLPTDKIVACPAGATVSGTSCTVNGADVSALVAVNAVSSFTLVPATPVQTTVQGTLNWTPPTLNTDGSPLTDLASFNITIDGTTVGQATSSSTSYSLGTLTVGETHKYGVAAVNADGQVSATAEVSYKTPSTAIKPNPASPTNISITVK